MKTIFISVASKRKLDIKLIENINRILPKKIAIVYSNQFEKLAKEIKEKLSEKDILSFMQVLGCSDPRFHKDTEAVLIIGEGKFHSVGIAYESKLPVYILKRGKIEKVDDSDVERLKGKEKGTYLKYLNSERVGILISTKPGQERLKKSIELSKKINDKKKYFFISNEINSNEFENFDIDSWVNTACPRMDFNDIPIINLDKLNL